MMFVFALLLFLVGGLASATIWQSVRPERSSAQLALGCLPFALALAATLAAFVLPDVVGRWRSPERHFRQIFGEPPLAGFSGLRASSSGGPDFAVEFVSFQASSPEVQAWLGKRGFGLSRDAEDWYGFDRDIQPVWWPSRPCPGSAAYHRQITGDWSRIVVLVCPQSGTVFAMADQID